MRDTFPELFPSSLVAICEERVLFLLREAGRASERLADAERNWNGKYDRYHGSQVSAGLMSRAWPEWLAATPNPFHYTGSQAFLLNGQICREFLSVFLASSVLDSLSMQSTQNLDVCNSGDIFTFMVLCGERLGRLTIHQHCATENAESKSWANFLQNSIGDPFILSCLSQLSSISSLCVHHVATNDMLYVISTVCHRLVVLDISHSNKVTDIGLVHLCGLLKGSSAGYREVGPRGCRYLRELYFNPQSSAVEWYVRKSEHVIEECSAKTKTDYWHVSTNLISFCDQIMPRVTACLLRHLPALQVLDLANLHAGIEHYYKGSRESTHRQSRVKPLNLIHYTGSDQLADVMHICPKLRNFKLFVTEKLPQLGATLKSLNQCLDQVTLVYNQHHVSLPHHNVPQEDILGGGGAMGGGPTHTGLTGFVQFLEACGSKICRLDVDSTQDTVISREDLVAFATHCPQIEAISFSNFRVEIEVDYRVSHAPVPTKPAYFPFLTSARFNNVSIEDHGKDIFRYLVGGAMDLEQLNISFHTPGYFFSDFLLDDILLVNDFAHLQHFNLRGGALTLISALRLISSRPKLLSIGELQHWDVEPGELNTFVQILRRARSLNLLQDIHIY